MFRNLTETNYMRAHTHTRKYIHKHAQIYTQKCTRIHTTHTHI